MKKRKRREKMVGLVGQRERAKRKPTMGRVRRREKNNEKREHA